MRSPSVAVIGTGFGGLAAVIELKKRGYDDIVVFEKADDVGGVWRENTYPGAACDVPSPFYSYSYEPNPRWPHRFSRQPAILDYIRNVADKYDVRRHVRFSTEVVSAAFDESTGKWTVETDHGDAVVVDVLVSAVGQLSRPSYPDIEGAETFEGPAFHSALWDHDVDLAGKRVAVIGTGASAVQFVPEIQPEVAQLTLFQRSAPYIHARPDREFSELHHQVFEKLPAALQVERGYWYSRTESLGIALLHSKALSTYFEWTCKRHMKKQTKAKAGLFEKIWPTYTFGCKRVLFSNDYLPALAQPNVEVETERITGITPTGVVTADGVEHETDVIIWGTGFKATEFLAPMSIKGAGGRDLHDVWRDGARAYYGISVPHFPNLFVMYGPNTNTGGGSIIFFLETQARYLGDYVDHLADVSGQLVVRPEVEQDFDERTQERLNDSVWSQCASWYRNENGRVTTNWPSLAVQYKAQAKFDPADYEVVGQ
ncbi:NAD(P)/FAD-dependent oxidoreductase [Nocardioides humilatus]|uniref:NAD(P)/FAD-dependent oxidoreductase n=1 Tax=Nocardioides humilatus TaxID=2607660 RepID=A0A5B1LAW4_9ACTN|nr:NAD(P)/FAD-dependent oxidoreductase [Nocardioides humilatus]KAA1416829.1 NAD(P)/FAD-dependent oxidoreductase [Nocardioides humilatus]